jgi:hypothetical protein
MFRVGRGRRVRLTIAPPSVRRLSRQCAILDMSRTELYGRQSNEALRCEDALVGGEKVMSVCILSSRTRPPQLVLGGTENDRSPRALRDMSQGYCWPHYFYIGGFDSSCHGNVTIATQTKCSFPCSTVTLGTAIRPANHVALMASLQLPFP